MRALVADDHPLYLEAARTNIERSIPDMTVVEATSFAQLMQGLDDPLGRFDLILMDYSMPGATGRAGVEQVIAAADGTPVVLMSGNAQPEEVSACIAAGVKGYLPKTLDARLFIAALNMILLGGTYVPVDVMQAVPSSPSPTAPPIRTLSSRETDVLRMIVHGASNKEIARELEIQEVTVKLHTNRIFNKLGVKNRAQAAVKAVDERLILR